MVTFERGRAFSRWGVVIFFEKKITTPHREKALTKKISEGPFRGLNVFFKHCKRVHITLIHVFKPVNVFFEGWDCDKIFWKKILPQSQLSKKTFTGLKT